MKLDGGVSWATLFDEAFAAAEAGCPVSTALREGIEVRAKGSLR